MRGETGLTTQAEATVQNRGAAFRGGYGLLPWGQPQGWEHGRESRPGIAHPHPKGWPGEPCLSSHRAHPGLGAEEAGEGAFRPDSDLRLDTGGGTALVPAWGAGDTRPKSPEEPSLVYVP